MTDYDSPTLDTVRALNERIAKLEELLAHERTLRGADTHASDVATIANHLLVAPKQAAILLALYRAKGRYLPSDPLMDIAEVESLSTVKVHICRLRSKYGSKVIETVFGKGYALTAKGRRLVETALNQHNEQGRAA